MKGKGGVVFAIVVGVILGLAVAGYIIASIVADVNLFQLIF